jgi:hypothetical protein
MPGDGQFRRGTLAPEGVGAAIDGVLDKREFSREWIWPNVPPAGSTTSVLITTLFTDPQRRGRGTQGIFSLRKKNSAPLRPCVEISEECSR